MPRSGRVRTSVARFTGKRSPSPDISCSTKLSVPTVPGETRLGMDMDRQRRIRRHPKADERGGNGDGKRTGGVAYHPSHIFVPEGIFMSILPSLLSLPAGARAPTPCTSSEIVTLPAFSNSSVTGSLSPCFSGLLRSNIIR